jgi:hypothetical protein
MPSASYDILAAVFGACCPPQLMSINAAITKKGNLPNILFSIPNFIYS